MLQRNESMTLIFSTQGLRATEHLVVKKMFLKVEAKVVFFATFAQKGRLVSK